MARPALTGKSGNLRGVLLAFNRKTLHQPSPSHRRSDGKRRVNGQFLPPFPFVRRWDKSPPTLPNPAALIIGPANQIRVSLKLADRTLTHGNTMSDVSAAGCGFCDATQQLDWDSLKNGS